MPDMQIEELIIRSARGETSAEEERRLALWRERSDRNEKRYQMLRRLVDHARQVEQEVETTPVTAAEVIRRAEQLPDVGRVPHLLSWMADRRPVLLRAAAVAVLLVAGLIVADRLSDPGTEGVAQRIEYRTDEGAGRSIQLQDGTRVHLGPASRLEVNVTEETVRLWLEGRGFFGVPPQERGPLVIATPTGQVKILGTRLEVRSGREDLRVLVVDGRVSVSVASEDARAERAEFEVKAGNMGIVRRGAAPTLLEVEDPLPHLTWMGQAMVFQATPLDQVLLEVGRRYGAEIELLDPELAARTLTTSFDGQTFPEVMRVVCRVVHVRCVIEDDRAIVTSPAITESP